VTVLLAGAHGDVPGAQPWLDHTFAHLGALYDGFVEGFGITFAQASDALGCALDLQRAPLDPVALSIGLHTAEPNCSTHGRAAELRDLVRPGHILLSAESAAEVADRLPAGAWLTDVQHGPDRLVQLCHPALGNEFPALADRGDGPVGHTQL
jgi:class 3 adenylate cyclase